MNRYAFRYLRDVKECLRDEELSTCVICALLRSGYGFIQMHEEGYNEYHVCESCLMTGRLAEKHLRVNEGDIETIRQQLYQQMQESTDEERDGLAAERTDEVELRTPRPSVLNLFIWPAHCGDYCVYFRRVNADDMNRLALNSDGKTFLATHLHPNYADVDEVFLENVWADKLNGFMRFYLWQCRQCSEYLLTCDSD